MFLLKLQCFAYLHNSWFYAAWATWNCEFLASIYTRFFRARLNSPQEAQLKQMFFFTTGNPVGQRGFTAASWKNKCFGKESQAIKKCNTGSPSNHESFVPHTRSFVCFGYFRLLFGIFTTSKIPHNPLVSVFGINDLMFSYFLIKLISYDEKLLPSGTRRLR